MPRFDALAARFGGLGLEPGDRIAMQLPNRVEQPLAMLAAWRTGLTVCALPMLWRHLEIAKVVAELNPRALIGVDAFAEEVPLQSLCEIAAEASIPFVLGFGAELPITVTSLDAALDAKIATVLDPASRGRAPLLITFTARAGASIVPVFCTERELLAQGAMTVMALKLDRSDVILNPYPFTAPAGLALGLMSWLISGGTLLQHQPFDAAAFAEQLIAGGATVTALPAAVIAGLQSDGALDDSHLRLKRLGRVWSPAELAEAPSEEAAEPDFDVFPLGDLASLVRPRQPGADPTLLPLGKAHVTGVDGHQALFLETTLGSPCDCGEAREIRVRGLVCPRGSSSDTMLAVDAQGFVGTGFARLPSVKPVARSN